MTFEAEPMSKMSAARFREYAQELLGLPMPPDDAPKEEIYKWGVAGMFLMSCREQGPAAGKILVTNFLLESSKEDDETMPLANIIPISSAPWAEGSPRRSSIGARSTASRFGAASANRQAAFARGLSPCANVRMVKVRPRRDHQLVKSTICRRQIRCQSRVNDAVFLLDNREVRPPVRHVSGYLIFGRRFRYRHARQIQRGTLLVAHKLGDLRFECWHGWDHGESSSIENPNAIRSALNVNLTY